MTIAAQKLHPLFVGEVSGVAPGQALDRATVALQAAIDDHAVLVFRGRPVAPEAQVAFAARFGPLEPRNGVLTAGITPRVTRQLVDISNLDENSAALGREDRRRMFMLGNQLWQTDSSFKRTPAKYSLLHAHTVTPPVHRALVRVHPGSGRKALYLASHASHIVGWPVPDGRMLRDLIEHATQPQFVYTHRWEVGDLVMWDNRCTMHRGRAYDEAMHRRDLRRATIEDLDPAVQDLRAA